MIRITARAPQPLARRLFVCGCCYFLVNAGLSQGTTLVPRIDFANATDYTVNFQTKNINTITRVATDDANFGAGGYLAATGNPPSGAVHNSFVYNVDPKGTNDLFTEYTLDADFRVQTGGQGLGFFFGGGTGTSKGWVFLSIDDTSFSLPADSGKDRVRFFSGRDIVSGGGTLQQDTPFFDVASSTATAIANSTGKWIHTRLSVDQIAGGSTTVTLQAWFNNVTNLTGTPGITSSFTYTSGLLSSSNSEIGLSLFTNSGTADLDNVAVYSLGTAPLFIPEPGTATLLAMGSVGVLLRLHRRR